MTLKHFLPLTGLLLLGCATAPPATSPAPTPTPAVGVASTTEAPAGHPASDVPPAVTAAFPTAQSLTTQHKDLSEEQLAALESQAKLKPTERDFHTYLAFTTANGTRQQIGAATVIKAVGQEVVIAYANVNGMPQIQEVRNATLPAAFLKQFSGKGHDDKLTLGADIKANGADDKTAAAVTDAIRLDVLTMQMLYGRAHSH